MLTIAYLLILLSALIHASWNALAKHIKGNTPALVLAHLFGAVFVFPFIFLDDDPWGSLRNKEALWLLLGSVVTHAAYVVSLSAAYVHGDVGLVYPLARGTPILFTAIGLQLLGVDDPLSPLALVGMLFIMAGIMCLCGEAFHKTKSAVEDGTNNDASGSDSNGEGIMNPLSGADSDYSSTLAEVKIESTAEADQVCKEVEMIAQNNENIEDGGCAHDIPDGNSAATSTDRKQVLKSIALAVMVGVCSASYSTIDALGVQQVPPLLFLFLMDVFSSLILFPFLYIYHYEETVLALTEHKLTILLISPCVVGSYLLILLVFSLFNVSVALVVAARTSSVLVGSFIGVIFLGERNSFIKFSSIVVMLIGIIVIKFS